MTAIETQQKINMGRKFGEIFGNTIKVSNPLLREFLAELVGTFCLMVSRAACF